MLLTAIRCRRWHRNKQRGRGVVLQMQGRSGSSPSCGNEAMPPIVAGTASERLFAYALRILKEASLAVKLEPPPAILHAELLEEARREARNGAKRKTPRDYGLSPSADTDEARRRQRQEDLVTFDEPQDPPFAMDIAWPAREGRIALDKNPKGGSDQLPKASKIMIDEDARLQCLRKFAQHELVAVEMFAWALLRFPAAPLGLRLGMLRTLQEEQEHCKLYLGRIRALTGDPDEAHPFGKPPLSNYLWRSIGAVRSAKRPLHCFLAGVGLTFEAANMDHVLRHKDFFLQAGDVESANVLQRVHDEEIQHVKLAHTWLSRLSDSGVGKTDVELYEESVAFPPFELHKAKGKAMLAINGRRRAGFSEEFIQAVRGSTRRRLGDKQNCV